ncbi:MAG TPA: DUF2917 domain-containing protein [Burkholderiaceae bacterium]|nr:DUF2917 domain-containing protein [Burkholderiaceae bacterium]
MNAIRNVVRHADLSRVTLARGRAFHVQNCHALRLRVEEGCAWVTLARCTEDFVLGRGETLLVDCNACVVVSATGSAPGLRVAMDTSRAAAPLWRAWLRNLWSGAFARTAAHAVS